SSIFRLYLNPEQPPGSTLTRRPAESGWTFSASMNLSTSSTARGVRTTWMPLAVWVCSSTELMFGLPCNPWACPVLGRRTPQQGRRDGFQGQLTHGVLMVLQISSLRHRLVAGSVRLGLMDSVTPKPFWRM